ncbi:hypothetical protein [Streptomyces sp. HC307]|uniref:hypothetical protein n=1 Tax=Streptomyces flavusporus TaxID=3385496 RepID=UPI003916CD93
MKYRQTASQQRGVAAISAIAALILTLSACGGNEQKRDYSIPDALCGVAVESDDLASFLPAGRDIDVRNKAASGVKTCEVVIDKKLIVTTTQAWLEEGKNTSYFAYSQSLENHDHSAEGGRFRYSGNEAFGKTDGCVDTQYGQELYTAVQAQGSEHSDADAMKRLITSFTSEVEASATCKASAVQE